jgi:hypothetical protein
MDPHKRGKSSLRIGGVVFGVALASAIAPPAVLGAPAAVDQYTEQLPHGPGGTGRGQQVTAPREGDAQQEGQGESPGAVPGAPGAGGGDPGAGSGRGASPGAGDPGAAGGESSSSAGQAGADGSSQGGTGEGSAPGSGPVSESHAVDSKTLPLGDYPSSSFVTVLVALAVAALLIAAGLGLRARFRQAGFLRG